MNNETLTLYKMMVLYMLSLVDHPLTNARISDFMLTKDYTDYFSLQTVFKEMTDAGLVSCKQVRNSSYFTITDEGINTLKLFPDIVSKPIKDDIKKYLAGHEHELKSEVSVLSDYSVNNKGENSVTLKLIDFDGSELLKLSLAVPSEKRAMEICNEWKDKSNDIYTYLVENIILKRKPQ